MWWPCSTAFFPLGACFSFLQPPLLSLLLGSCVLHLLNCIFGSSLKGYSCKPTANMSCFWLSSTMSSKDKNYSHLWYILKRYTFEANPRRCNSVRWILFSQSAIALRLNLLYFGIYWTQRTKHGAVFIYIFFNWWFRWSGFIKLVKLDRCSFYFLGFMHFCLITTT